MIEAIMGLASSSGLGVITGVIGNAVGRWQERKQQEQEARHEIEMRNLDLREMELQHSQQLELADKQIEQAETEGKIAADVADAEAFTQSIKAAQAPTGIAWVDAVRALTRPVITLYLLAVTTYTAVVVFSEVGGLSALPADRLLQTADLVIQQVLFLATVAVTWWFGTRRQGPVKAGG